MTKNQKRSRDSINCEPADNLDAEIRDWRKTVHTYIDEVLSGDRVAGKLVRSACERQVSDLAKAETDWPFEFDESKAVTEDEDFFVGLGIDEDQQPELTAVRIDEWVDQIKEEFGI